MDATIKPLSDEAIAELARLHEAATLGRWDRNIAPASRYPIIYAGRNTHVVEIITRSITPAQAEANASLVPKAVNAIPALLAERAADKAEIERLRAENAKLANILGRLPMTADGVAITPGMSVWILPPEWRGDAPYEKTVGAVWQRRIQYAVDQVCSDGESGAKCTLVYSTLDAALAAAPTKVGG